MKLTGFEPFDTSTGGLGCPGAYVACGLPSAGKTSFALSFLYRGLMAGETVALVTDQAPPRILDKARQLGFHFNDFVASKQLMIFEYPDQVASAVAKLEDHSRIVEEFHGLLGNRRVERVAFDPINPLLGLDPSPQARESRFGSVISCFGRLRACIFYVVEDPSGAAAAPAQSLHGVLAFHLAGKKRRHLAADLFAPARTSHLFAFEIREGAGLRGIAEEHEESEPIVERPVEAIRLSPPPARSAFNTDDFGDLNEPDRPATPTLNELRAAVSPPAPAYAPPPAPVPLNPSGGNGPRILLVEADTSRRVMLRAQLERNFVVIEASGVHDTLTLAAMGRPDAILLALDMPGVSGVELARSLREKGHNVLLVGLGDRRQLSERLSALAAGIDLCFSYSADPRVLRLTLLNLMQRLGRTPARDLNLEVARIARKPEEEVQRCTQDISKFSGRIARETLYSRENGLPFVLLAFRLPQVPEAIEQFAALAASQTSVSDLVYAGPSGVACLLAETASPQGFLTRLWEQWKGGFSPTVEELRFANQDAFLQRAREFVVTRAGSTQDRKPMALAAGAAFGGWKIAGGDR
ncbi:MAG: ATPase domain-containing protein [Bryobacteraceae bacterium]